MIVLDPSVGLKWILAHETDREKAQQLYKDHIEGKREILVPTFFFLELANSLVTKTFTQLATIERDIKFIYSCKLIVYNPDRHDLLIASRLAKKYKTTVYDMLYALVAKLHKTILVTADKRFVEKTKFPYVKLLSEVNR